MICELYTLKKEYRDKKIYIWNVNRDSMVIFLNVALRRLDISGFVTIEEELVGKIYMNRPIVHLSQIEQEEDSIVIVFYKDRVPEARICMLPDNKYVYWEEALEINDELRQKRIIIYGAGYGAEQVCKVLNKEGMEAELYCVTEKKGLQSYRGKKVIEPAELIEGDYGDYAVIISMITTKYREEVLEILSEFSGWVYIEGIRPKASESYLNLIQKVWFAVTNHRKIYLYSKKNMIAELIVEMLGIYGINISGYVYEVGEKKNGIESIYELVYKGDIDDKLIIINEEIPERLIRARENIELAGFTLENFSMKKGTYTGIQRYTCANDELRFNLYRPDPLTGESILYPNPKDKPGCKVYGKEEKDRIRIMVLGGSTSSEIFHPEIWVSKLYHKLNKEGMKATIYNEAHPGNSVLVEVLRLLRDGYPIQPHIVISMSGVNDLSPIGLPSNKFSNLMFDNWIKTLTSYKDNEYCKGLDCDESLYSFWCRCQKLMNVISEFYGAKFFGFLQPMNVTMSHMSLWEKSFYEEEARSIGAKEFINSAEDGNDYTNLLRIFEHQDEMYIDAVHYSDKGCEVIADKVYEAIMPAIQKLM